MQTWNACAGVHEGWSNVRVLVTGADGFVGRHLVQRLIETGHEVIAASRPGVDPESWLKDRWRRGVRLVSLELADSDSVRQALRDPPDGVVHLAAVASVREARDDPGKAWVVNAAGTARLVDALLSSRKGTGRDPMVLIASSAEVYGKGSGVPRTEQDPPSPQSPYAASKVGSEVAALEAWRRAGLRVLIARPFTHTGPGQRPPYVVPSFVERLLAAKASSNRQIPTGNLEPVRDLLDVRDVVEAYLGLLGAGSPGEIYNIARGEGITLREVFRQVAAVIGVEAEPVADPALVRPEDIPHLVGDATKLRRTTGWSPSIPLEQTVRDIVNAQTN
jgi:GDP-4-dehydro-6-deoxy-D-mannose reductase